jgi:hypothetical protein
MAFFPSQMKKGAHLQCVTFAVRTDAQAIQPLYKRQKQQYIIDCEQK